MYQKGTLVKIDDDYFLEREKVDYKSSDPDEYHTVIAGENLTKIAWEKYKDYTDDPSKYYWFIADVNDEISNPLDLSHLIGKDILIPNFYRFKLSQ